MKKKLFNEFLANPFGKSTLFRVDWKNFDEIPSELYVHDIFIIVKENNVNGAQSGYTMIDATFINKRIIKSEWKTWNIDNPEHRKELVAWGVLTLTNKMVELCPVCKEFQCIC